MLFEKILLENGKIIRIVNFDVIVIGGGHAGMEAAAASARNGAKTALVTINSDNLGEMSCNPAIGGIGKGTIVREIDSLDGVMAKFIDKASIHTKILNSSKGPAVWGLRAQADRKLYKKIAQETLMNYQNLTIVEGMVGEILEKDGKILGISLETGEKITCKALVVTTGTFLKGIIHQGESTKSAGRMGENPSIGLSNSLKNIGVTLGRLKTGTPCRIYRDSIDYSNLEFQAGDVPPMPFSYFTKSITQEQIVCHITYTNEKTHEIIRAAKDRSPMDNGQISSRGPRYCPSIEDKIRRFSDKERHQIFLEPEGLDSELVYPNGISTAMPVDIQEAFIRTIPGLENCKISQFGYAIEYDYIDARNLRKTLAYKGFDGLFMAGQINGTTGYEEAAGQGLIAGVNAALLALGAEKELILDRSSSFIGVMIDDLTTLGVNGEPYRMFTSRSEYRLSIRNDNADLRLTPQGIEIGCVGVERCEFFENRLKNIQNLQSDLRLVKYSPVQLLEFGINISQDGVRRDLFELLSNKNIGFDDILKIKPDLEKYSQDIRFALETDAKYHFYIKRQDEEIASMKRGENIKIPLDFAYKNVKSLSNEVVEKLGRTRPETIADAAKIPGVTPAAIMAIIVYLSLGEK